MKTLTCVTGHCGKKSLGRGTRVPTFFQAAHSAWHRRGEKTRAEAVAEEAAQRRLAREAEERWIEGAWDRRLTAALLEEGRQLREAAGLATAATGEEQTMLPVSPATPEPRTKLRITTILMLVVLGVALGAGIWLLTH